MVVCLERGADLHMVQLMPLQLTVSCFSKIQIGFAFLVPAHPGSPGQRAAKRVCVRCVAVSSRVNPLWARSPQKEYLGPDNRLMIVFVTRARSTSRGTIQMTVPATVTDISFYSSANRAFTSRLQ